MKENLSTNQFDGEQEIPPVSEVIRQKLSELYEDNNVAWAEEVKIPFSDQEDGLSKIFQDNPVKFFDELIRITETNRDQNLRKTEDFLMSVRGIFFGYSPNIANNLSIEDMLVTTAKVNRIEEMRGLMGQDIIGELVYELAYAQEGVSNKLIEKIETLPDGEREDVINQLETIYSNAVGNGDWSESAVENINITLSHFINSSKPLTRIVAEVAFERSKKEDKNPSVGVITWAGNKGAGRLNSYYEIESVSDKFESNLPLGYKAVITAKDAIVGVDHAGMPRFVAFEKESLAVSKMPDTGVRILHNLELIRGLSFFDADIRQVINTLEKFWKIFEQEKSISSFYAEILELPEATVSSMIKTGVDFAPSFQKNWENIREKILSKVDAKIKFVQDSNIKKVYFESFAEVSKKEELNPFGPIDKNDMLLLSQCLRPEARICLEKELGVSFNDISLRGEIALLRFLSKENSTTYDRLCSVLTKNSTEKVKILETFVGCSQDNKFGDEFITLCEQLSEDELVIFLDLYSKIVFDSQGVHDLILADERSGKITSDVSLAYTNIAIRKAREMLRVWTEKSITAHKKGDKYIPNKKELELYRNQEVQSAVFSSIFRQARKEKGVDAIEIVGGFESKPISELSEVEKEQVRLMYKENYEANNPKLYKVLLDVFEKRSVKENVTVYMLKDKNKIVSFLTLEPFISGGLYFASFNTKSNYQNTSVGDAMMRKVLDENAQEQIIHADCSAFSPIGAKYIEDGFVGISFYDYEDSPSLEIVRDDHKVFKTKQMPREDFIKNVPKGDFYTVVKTPAQSEIDMTHITKGLVLTRYFSEGPDSNKTWYAVFEQVNSYN